MPIHSHTSRNTVPLALLGFLLMMLFFSASADSTSDGPVSTSRIGKVAIGGYDSVAYHDPNAINTHTASEGSKGWVVEWRGAKWRFVSEESYNAFKADPEKYRPAYGGFCSNALSLGEGLIRTDGAHWEILDDRLHLFYAARGRDRWLDGNHARYREQADLAWKEITGFDDL
ncbi:MAG: YHS domain-containing (seleno)protein [bacterium]